MKVQDRLAKLKVWQQEKKEKKEKEKQNKKKPFVAGGSTKPGSTRPVTRASVKAPMPGKTRSSLARPESAGSKTTSKAHATSRSSATHQKSTSTRMTGKAPPKVAMMSKDKKTTTKPHADVSVTECKEQPGRKTVYVPDSTSKQPRSTVVSLAKEHPAWIPGARVGTPSGATSAEQFDAVFGSSDSYSPFRPFQFTGLAASSNQPFKFTFKKNLPSVPPSDIIAEDSLDEEEEQEEEEDMPQPVSDTSQERVNANITHNNDVLNQQLEDDTTTQLADSLSEPSTAEVGKEEDKRERKEEEEESTTCDVDVAHFRKLHDDVVRHFGQLCCEWEEKMKSLEESLEDQGKQSLQLLSSIMCHI